MQCCVAGTVRHTYLAAQSQAAVLGRPGAGPRRRLACLVGQTVLCRVVPVQRVGQQIFPSWPAGHVAFLLEPGTSAEPVVASSQRHFSLSTHRRNRPTDTSNMSDSKELSHPMIKDGWFAEISDTMWPGQAMSLRVKKVLNAEQTKYQDLLVFESTDYGNVLVLDGAIQATERDEFAYQEMIAHLALNSHSAPKKVLVIGGGDGGVLREVVKHECVQEAVLCDIDEGVIRNAKKYLPGMSSSFDNPKVKVHIGDGFKFLAEYKNTFDVIITDSSDPEGPAASLFEKPYFQLLSEALTENGVITTQAESIWIHLEIIKNLKSACKAVFPNVEYAYCTIPTYPSGQIGFMVCSKNKSIDLKRPLRSVDAETEKKLYKYYSKEIHEASFVLPNFARYALE